MGRGRAKAKQTKVARQLKYNSAGMDVDRLARELGVNESASTVATHDDAFELDERYSAYADYQHADEDDDEEDDDEADASESNWRAEKK